MKYLISILIPTLIERKNEYRIMLHNLYRQVEKHNLKEKVEIISICDDRSISLCEKRNTLQKLCSGKYFMHLDDDDELSCDYCKTIIDHIEGLNEDYDIIGYNQLAKVSGKRFIVKPNIHAGLSLTASGNQYNRNMILNNEIPEFFRYPWQFNLWHEKFKNVYRTESDSPSPDKPHMYEDLNWVKKLQLEHPKNMSYCDFIGHTYNFDDPSKTTSQ
tara:strand:+ start:1510 stop:2157 length:648 start_codon:yes stop_codon:yes gene_type:complete